MSEPSESALAAAMRTSARASTRDILSAAMDPVLGPDRLVVAGPHEQEIIAKVCEWLCTTEDREGNDAALAHGALDSGHIARMIWDRYSS